MRFLSPFVTRILHSVFLFVSGSATICFVVMSGKEYPHYQYAFALCLAVFAVLLSFIVDLVTRGRRAFHIPRSIFRWNCAPLIGLYWAINTVFMSVANPHTPGLVQVILHEINPVVVTLVTFIFYKKQYTWFQWIAILLVISGNLFPVFDPNMEGAEPSPIRPEVWYLFYTIGILPIPLVILRTEAVLKDVERETDPYSVPQLYAVSSLFTVLGVIIMCWFSIVTDGSSIFFGDLIEGLTKILTFHDVGAIWCWMVMILAVPTNLFTSYVMVQDDAIWATLILTFAPVVSSIVMGTKEIFGPYYSPVHWTTLVGLGLVLLAVILYRLPDFYRLCRPKEKHTWKEKTHGETSPLLHSGRVV